MIKFIINHSISNQYSFTNQYSRNKQNIFATCYEHVILSYS